MIKSYLDGKEYLDTEYFVNGKPFSTFGIEVMEKSGLFNILSLKERQSISLAGQHGVLLDRSGQRYEPREIELDLAFLDGSGISRDKLFEFRNEFLGSTPARFSMREEYSVYVWDVDWDSVSNSDFPRWYVSRTKIKLIETAPIKHVYVVNGTSASFKTAATEEGETQQPLLFSWGDNSFTDSVRAATTTHTYTDGYDKHYVIISGVISEVDITTDHTLSYKIEY